MVRRHLREEGRGVVRVGTGVPRRDGGAPRLRRQVPQGGDGVGCGQEQVALDDVTPHDPVTPSPPSPRASPRPTDYSSLLTVSCVAPERGQVPPPSMWPA